MASMDFHSRKICIAAEAEYIFSAIRTQSENIKLSGNW